MMNLLVLTLLWTAASAISVSDVMDFFTHRFHRAAHKSMISMTPTFLHPEEDHKLHTVVVAVKLRNVDKLEKFVHEVSDPHHAKYGQHMTKAQVAELIVDREATEKVREYLEQHGAAIVRESTFGDFVTAAAPVKVWNNMFRTRLHRCEVTNHITQETMTLVRGKEYSLPWALVGVVDEVFNLIQVPPAVHKHQVFRRISKTERNDAAAGAYAGYTTPAVINSYYNVTNNTGSALFQQSVYESLNQTASPSDLTLFQQTFNLTIEAIAEDINGHLSDSACDFSYGINGCAEANLDVQYLMGIAQRTPTVYYYWGGEDFLLDWITEVASMTDPPAIFSISYGGYESDCDTSYLVAFNQQAIILAAVGTTIFVSSGDDGVSGYFTRDAPANCAYNPQFPASSPMVTSVGGTDGPQAGRTEVVCQANENGAVITSGGGFSSVYARPSWQNTVISQYFSTVAGTDRAGVPGYTTAGRGYPDVSLLAHDYVIFTGGVSIEVDGTSASSPVMAAFATLINAYRLRNGQSKLGWLNPALYAYASSFVRDITAGNNNCTAGSPPVCCTQGFYAVEGWDPATGLGSVNFGMMLSTLGNLNSTALDNTNYDDALNTLSFDNNDDTFFTSTAIAGIVIGCVLGAVVIIALVYVFCWRKAQPVSTPLLDKV